MATRVHLNKKNKFIKKKIKILIFFKKNSKKIQKKKKLKGWLGHPFGGGLEALSHRGWPSGHHRPHVVVWGWRAATPCGLRVAQPPFQLFFFFLKKKLVFLFIF
jgi:hypothetical protein